MSRKKEIAKMVDEDNHEDFVPEVIFAPGCFDDFEGTQEELDALQKEIMDMFTGKTVAELKEQSMALDVNELDDEQLEMLVNAVNGFERRNLQ